ncbi:protein TolR [Azoarcus communis]|uniref:Protein TolR n=1 Tax=Parazoarcus communis SWub3 = DSM 12120 TaxID=1121029 RepID=A0A323V0S8_9RHOO|nr:ExbD/TolR family protein [Parazoarcus communis]NMG48698.1 protein TolR [Parazoarcus communis]NMG69138.1 protein TolR [Parazoarcus communis SWub3 = DSM 12120]PZA18385.1 protein TolR [Azoarcus communis] [Parazoarcus communis SWub3 = DSM 12120]
MRQRRLMNQINVVPYIDVMLVLLVIFMVTAPMVQPGNIEVPSAGPLAAPPSEAMIIEVGKDGSLALRETSNASARKLTEIEFQRALQTAMAAKPEQSFLVRADSSLPYQKVIDVLEAARELGVRKIGLETRSSSGGK